MSVVSRAVARGSMVYVQAAGAQTRSVLDHIDALLAAFSEWINGQHSPLLSCKPAALAHPDALVEITVTAAR